MINPIFNLEEHKHNDHSHIKLTLGRTYTEKGGLKISDEGCPCCAAGIDLDEVATAISEIGKEGNTDGGSDGSHLEGGLSDFTSPTHWGIFLGISGPLSVVGLTAAIRNIKGTMNTRKKLNHVIEGIEKDIEKYRQEGNTSVVERLEAFKNCLNNSKFDTDFNLVVPGVINGLASGIVLSSAIWHSPWALPVIAVYSACQTGRNVYELIRTWNRILPETLTIKPLEVAGVKKVNQITKSKRKFYTANSLGFLIFTTGAVVLFLSILSVTPGIDKLILGIGLLTFGAISTGIMNNIWTNKFKPRNGNLGIDRKELNCWQALEEIGKRREIKKILKIYQNKHMPYSISENFTKFGYKILTSLPFCEQKGAALIHKMNVKKCKDRNYTPTGTLIQERLELLESMVQILTPNFQFPKDESNAIKVFRALKELELEGVILEKFIKDYILKTSNEHDTSISSLDEYKKKLLTSGFFKDVTEENDNKKVKIEFDLEKLEQNTSTFKEFMNSLEQYLLFEHIEKLRYQQYGLNDYFWELDKCQYQWKREYETQDKKISIENMAQKVELNPEENHHHKEDCDQKHKHHHSTDSHKYHECSVC